MRFARDLRVTSCLYRGVSGRRGGLDVSSSFEPRKGAARAGLRTLRRRVQLQGLACLDKRSAGGQELLYWRRELFTALGGEDDLSPQKKMLVELATRQRLIISHIDAFIFSLPSLINRRKKIAIPIVMQRATLAESLQKTLDRLGLEKQMKKVEELDAWIERRAKEKAEAGGDEAQNTEPAADDH
ncbi:MAG: hypothetical protein ABSE19_08740 [Candidatus Acidiferrum sp.]|jgi:hypothetical protein